MRIQNAVRRASQPASRFCILHSTFCMTEFLSFDSRSRWSYRRAPKGALLMHSKTKFWLLIALLVATSWAPSSARAVAQSGQGPKMASIGPLAFGPDGTLFAADNQGAMIVALDLGAQAAAGAPGARSLDALDEKLAALLGTGARDVTITDLAVHPKTRNAYVSVMRGQGA